MKVQSIAFTNEGLQITYIEDRDVYESTGVVKLTTLDVPHAIIPNSLLDDLVDSVTQIVDHVNVANRQPEERFVQPR